MGSTCPRYFPSSPGDFGGSFNISYHFNYCSANPDFDASSGVWQEIHSPRPVQKLIFLFPISADGRRGLFPLWDSSQSFGFYLLPSPVRRFVRATICPCAPIFTHPVTEYKHLLISILNLICYLRNWPRLSFLTAILMLIQTRGIVEIPYFSSLSGRPRDIIYIVIGRLVCFVVSHIFNVVRHTRCFKLRSKPGWFYVSQIS